MTSVLAMAAMPLLAKDDIAKTVSPNGRLVVTTYEDGGKIFYTAAYDGREVVMPSRLGLVANFGSLAEGLNVDSLYEGEETYSYNLETIKVSDVEKSARKQIVYVSNKARQVLGIEVVVEDNAVAFRYIIPKQGETGSVRVMSEATEFRSSRTSPLSSPRALLPMSMPSWAASTPART